MALKASARGGIFSSPVARSYAQFLGSGETYYITVSKRLLFRPFVPLWIALGLLFLVRNAVFEGGVVLPCLIFYGIAAFARAGFFRACAVKRVPYIIFHIVVLVCLKLVSYGISELLLIWLAENWR